MAEVVEDADTEVWCSPVGITVTLDEVVQAMSPAQYDLMLRDAELSICFTIDGMQIGSEKVEFIKAFTWDAVIAHWRGLIQDGEDEREWAPVIAGKLRELADAMEDGTVPLPMWLSDFEAMSAAEKMAYIQGGGAVRD